MLKKLLPLILILALLLTACGAPADAEEPDDPPETSPEAPSSEEPEEDVLPELVRLLTAETVQLSDSVTFTTPAAADISLDEETAAMYVNNTLLVFAQAGADRSEIEALAESSGASIVGETPVLDLYQFRFPEALDLDGLRSRIEALEASDLVDAVDVDYLMEISGEYTPDDPWYDSEYPDADANRWGIEAIHAEEAWDYLGYMNPVTIGLMEEVTSTDHKDLNVLTVINASAASAATSTFYASVDLGNHDHGTHVAGTMAAIPDNGIGITGVCAVPGTDVLICNDWGNISVGHFMSAITTMVTFYDVQVINISQSSCQPVQCFAASQGVEAAQEALAEQAETAARSLRRLLDHGFEFVLCLAAGNENDETYYKDSTAQLDGALRRTYGYTSDKSALFAGDTAYSGANARYSHFLAAIDDAELRDRIIVVGNAMQSADGGYESAPSSNVGLRVDIMAPGKDIYSLEYEGGYRTMSGTSMAAPHVSGVAAMLFACDPTLTGAEVKDYICSTADHTYALRFDGVEAGMLRADTAVEALLTDLGCLQPAGFPTALDMMDMTHEELRTIGWDSVWGASSGQSTAGFSEEYILLDASYAFTFVLEDPKGLSTPGYLHVRDGQNGGMALSITDSIATGMTYGQIAAAGGSLTPLDENNQARLETEDDWRITLLFDGSGGGAVLTAAKITPAANAQS